MSRINYIRQEEKKYHDFCYENYKLFEEGSWLVKPVKTVMDGLTLFNEREQLKVLDLGSGVGRNSIPIAREIKSRGGKVTCIDFLETAIERLKEYSTKYDVADAIIAKKLDIGKLQLKKQAFDYIIAVSSLEHLSTIEELKKVVTQMAEGTTLMGINCIIVNSEVEEYELTTNEQREALIEINSSTETMIAILKEIYQGWEIITQLTKPLQYQIFRNEKPVLLKTKAVTYVVRKKSDGCAVF